MAKPILLGNTMLAQSGRTTMLHKFAAQFAAVKTYVGMAIGPPPFQAKCQYAVAVSKTKSSKQDKKPLPRFGYSGFLLVQLPICRK